MFTLLYYYPYHWTEASSTRWHYLKLPYCCCPLLYAIAISCYYYPKGRKFYYYCQTIWILTIHTNKKGNYYWLIILMLAFIDAIVTSLLNATFVTAVYHILKFYYSLSWIFLLNKIIIPISNPRVTELIQVILLFPEEGIIVDYFEKLFVSIKVFQV